MQNYSSSNDSSSSSKLQALVYQILPSTTAVFSYAIGSRKLSTNEQVFCCCCWCSNSSKFVTNNSDYIRRLLTPAQIKPKSFESRRNLFFLFYPGWMRLMFTCVLGRLVVSTVLSVPKPFGAR